MFCVCWVMTKYDSPYTHVIAYKKGISDDRYNTALNHNGHNSVMLYKTKHTWPKVVKKYTETEIAYDDSLTKLGRGHCVIVQATCLENRRSRVRPPLWHSGFKIKQKFVSRSLVKIQYCWESPWPRGSVFCLRPSGLEFRILWLEGHLIHLTIL